MTAETPTATAQPGAAKSPPAMARPHGSTTAAGTAAAAPGAYTRKDAHPMRHHLSLTDLVVRARNGDTQAWGALVDRYAPLIWSICHRYQLADADAGRAGHSVWTQLAGQLDTIRDPAVLPGWLATTTRRECCRILRAAQGPHDAAHAPDAEIVPDDHATAADQELLTAERHVTLREAFAHLSPCCQQLIILLAQDPSMSYAEVSARLGIPARSIGPTRRRCLDKLRRYPAIAALISADPQIKG
jgi:RNA polymerase sigma factor (sigma-70 family)